MKTNFVGSSFLLAILEGKISKEDAVQNTNATFVGKSKKICPICGGVVSKQSAAGLKWEISSGCFKDIPPTVFLFICESCGEYSTTEDEVCEIVNAINRKCSIKNNMCQTHGNAAGECKDE